jgi:hypothetical protein
MHLTRCATSLKVHDKQYATSNVLQQANQTLSLHYQQATGIDIWHYNHKA